MALLDSTDTSQSAPTVFTGAHGRPDSRADRLPLFGLKMPEQRYFASVQGMRGISALSVLVVHIYLMALHGGFFPPVPAWVAAALSTFGNGVALFFIISGFVIPASLFRHGNVTRFMIDRVLRIMPVFLAIHFLVFALGPLIGYKWLEGIGAAEYWKLFLTNMTFTALPLGLPLAQQNSWTLTYEWGFYLLVSLMWALLFLTNRRWLMGVVIVATAVGICIAFPVCI
jgi:peptidoglycan/LPS O-acetylase OafA/YrhL